MAALFGNMKVMCAAVASQLILSKPINTVQWVGLLLLVCALSVSKIKSLLNVKQPTATSVEDDNHIFLLGFVCILTSSVCSG